MAWLGRSRLATVAFAALGRTHIDLRTRSLLQIGAPLLRFVNVADGNSPGLLLRQIRSGIQRIRGVKTTASSAFASSWR